MSAFLGFLKQNLLIVRVNIKQGSVCFTSPYNMLFIFNYGNLMVPWVGHGFQHLPHQTLYFAYC